MFVSYYHWFWNSLFFSKLYWQPFKDDWCFFCHAYSCYKKLNTSAIASLLQSFLGQLYQTSLRRSTLMMVLYRWVMKPHRWHDRRGPFCSGDFNGFLLCYCQFFKKSSMVFIVSFVLLWFYLVQRSFHWLDMCLTLINHLLF